MGNKSRVTRPVIGVGIEQRQGSSSFAALAVLAEPSYSPAMKRHWMNSSEHELRFARCVAPFVGLVASSFQVAQAAQDSVRAPRLCAADEFVMARTPAASAVEVADSTPSFTTPAARSGATPVELEPHLSPFIADAIAANPAPKNSAPQDPAIPHHPALTDRFYIGLGGFFATSSTEAKLKSPSGVGTSVNFEDALGLSDREWTPQALARFRMTENWRIELEYFSLRRSGTQTITAQIDWGGQVFPINTQVDSKFNIDVTRLSVGYSFFKRPDKEIGVALGLHLTDIEAELAGPTAGSAKRAAALAPLPVLSFYGQVALTNTWALDGRFDVFKLEYDPYQGSIVSAGVDLVYQPWRNFGFGLGYRTLDIDASVDKNSWNGSVNSSYQGPIAFIFSSF